MKSKVTQLYLLIFMSMISLTSNAQPDPDGTDDPLPAPIDKYVIILAIVGIYFAYTFFNKRMSVKNK